MICLVNLVFWTQADAGKTQRTGPDERNFMLLCKRKGHCYIIRLHFAALCFSRFKCALCTSRTVSTVLEGANTYSNYYNAYIQVANTYCTTTRCKYSKKKKKRYDVQITIHKINLSC